VAGRPQLKACEVLSASIYRASDGMDRNAGRFNDEAGIVFIAEQISIA